MQNPNSINEYLLFNAESEGQGQDFGIGSILVSVCSPGSTDQSRFGGMLTSVSSAAMCSYFQPKTSDELTVHHPHMMTKQLTDRGTQGPGGERGGAFSS